MTNSNPIPIQQNQSPIPNQQVQASQQYPQIQNNYKTEFSYGNVSCAPVNTQWTTSYPPSLSNSNTLPPNPPALPGNSPSKTGSNAENSIYKNWKLKFSSKDSNGFHCLVCQGKSFTADSSLKRHYKQVHEQTCKTCKMQFSEECILNQHIKDNHEFRCKLCDKVFSANSSLKRHHDQQHGGSMPNQGQPMTQSGFQATTQLSNINQVSFKFIIF